MNKDFYSQVEYTVRTGYTGENEDEDDDHEFINNQGDEEEIDLQVSSMIIFSKSIKIISTQS